MAVANDTAVVANSKMVDTKRLLLMIMIAFFFCEYIRFMTVCVVLSSVACTCTFYAALFSNGAKIVVVCVSNFLIVTACSIIVSIIPVK